MRSQQELSGIPGEQRPTDCALPASPLAEAALCCPAPGSVRQQVLPPHISYYLRETALEHKDTLARGLRIEEPIRLLCLIEAKAVREHPIHRHLALGDKAGTVRLSDRVKRPGGENSELLADHVRTDLDSDVVAFCVFR
jgi:hypothetical protein